MSAAAVSLHLQARQVQLQLSSPAVASGVQEVSRVCFSPPSSSASLAVADTYVRQCHHQSSRLRRAGRAMAAHAEAPESIASSSGSGSCCGGGGGSGSGGGCSSSKKTADVSGVGKEFEAMVAASTMAELEKGYLQGEMQGMITREVVQEVMAIQEPSSTKSEEKFLDVDQILSDARKMSSGDFIFGADLDEMIV